MYGNQKDNKCRRFVLVSGIFTERKTILQENRKNNVNVKVRKHLALFTVFFAMHENNSYFCTIEYISVEF